jgi:hypothetical protein
MEAQNKLDKFRAIGHKALRQKRIASLQTKLNKVELLLGAKSLKAFERGLSSSESSSESDSNSDHESISELNFNVKIQNEEEALPLVVSTLILNEKDAKSALRGTLKGFILNNIKGTSTPSSGTRVEELDSDEESLYESFFSDKEILDESKKVISNDDQLEDELLTKLAGLKVT